MYVPSVTLPSNEVVLGSILDIVEHVEKIGALTASRKRWTDSVFSRCNFDLESSVCLIYGLFIWLIEWCQCETKYHCTKSHCKFLFELGCELVVNVLIVPVLPPLFGLDFRRNVLTVVCWIKKDVPSSSNSSKSSSSSSKSFNTSGSFCTSFFFCYYLAWTSLA